MQPGDSVAAFWNSKADPSWFGGIPLVHVICQTSGLQPVVMCPRAFKSATSRGSLQEAETYVELSGSVEPYHCYMETLVMSQYIRVVGARLRPDGLTAGTPIMRVKLISHAGLVIVVLVSAGRVVAACEREDPLCEGPL